MKLMLCGGGGFASNCYLLFDDSERTAIVVDPSVPYAEALSHLAPNIQVSAIVLTHAHADHLLYLDDWRRQTKAPVLIGAADLDSLQDPERNCSLFLGLGARSFGKADRLLSDGDEIALGDESLRVLLTPGHSPGSICLLGDVLISGDTVFAFGGVGRTDFQGGSPELLTSSLMRLLSLPEETVIYPGHGPRTTVANERAFHANLLK